MLVEVQRHWHQVQIVRVLVLAFSVTGLLLLPMTSYRIFQNWGIPFQVFPPFGKVSFPAIRQTQIHIATLVGRPSSTYHLDEKGEITQQESRLQLVQGPCRHDDPYIIQVIASRFLETDVAFLPIFKLWFGESSVELSFDGVTRVRRSQVIQSRPVFLSNRPHRLELFYWKLEADTYGYSQILMIHGEETYPVLMDPSAEELRDGLPPGNNEYWVRGSRPRNQDEVAIPTHQQFTIGIGMPYRIVFMQSARVGAWTNSGPQVVIRTNRSRTVLHTTSFGLPDRTYWQTDPVVLPDQYPETIEVIGTGAAFGYRDIVMYQGMKRIPILDPILGAFGGLSAGNNSYWVQAPSWLPSSGSIIATRHSFPVPSPDQFFIEIVTSMRPLANATCSPQVILWLTDKKSLVLNAISTKCTSNCLSRPVELGETLRTEPLFLLQRPYKVTVVGVGASYGYRQISLIHGREATTIVDSVDGRRIGVNIFWVGHAVLKDKQTLVRQWTFPVPAVSTRRIKTKTSTTTTTILPHRTLSLEVVTAARLHAAFYGTQTNHLLATVRFHTSHGIKRHLGVLVHENQETQALGCKALQFEADGQPISIDLQLIGHGFEEWGFRAIYLLEESRTIAVVDSSNGEPLSNHDSMFWLANNRPNLLSTRTFLIPNETATIVASS